MYQKYLADNSEENRRIKSRLRFILLTTVIAAVMICMIGYFVGYLRMVGQTRKLTDLSMEQLNSDITVMSYMMNQDSDKKSVYVMVNELNHYIEDHPDCSKEDLAARLYEFLYGDAYAWIDSNQLIFLGEEEPFYEIHGNTQGLIERLSRHAEAEGAQYFPTDLGLLTNESMASFNEELYQIVTWESLKNGVKVGIVADTSDYPTVTYGVDGVISTAVDTTVHSMSEMTATIARHTMYLVFILIIIVVALSGPIVNYYLAPILRRKREQLDLIRDVEQEKKLLMELDQMKTECLADISHELKTPLNIISGYAQTSETEIEYGADQENLKNKMHVISAEANRLAIMVTQILDATRIEEGRMSITKSPCHIDELLYQMVETYFDVLNTTGNELRLELSPEVPVINADPNHINRIFLNLLMNAMRHTQNGKLTITTEYTAPNVRISFTDTGEGMDAEKIKQLFTRYYTNMDKQRGTGLGLYICKQLVELHNGSVYVVSAPGEGSTFTIELPVA